MMSGIVRYQPESAMRHDRHEDRETRHDEHEAPQDDAGGASLEAAAGEQRDGEHAQRERRDRESGLQRVVLEHHLQVDREHDHRAAEGDLLQQLAARSGSEHLRLEERRVEQRGLAAALATAQPEHEEAEPEHADADDQADVAAALLPHQDAGHDAAHADDRQQRADEVDRPLAVVRHVLHEADAGQHDGDDDGLEREADPPREERGDESAEQRADRGGDGGGGPDEGVHPLLLGALEVAVDERLHGGQEQRGADAADDRPEDDDRGEVLCEHHRDRADRVAEQAEDVGELAPDEVAGLAADQDERRRDERLEGDRPLHAAHRRVEVRARPPRSTRSSATCRRRARTSPSRAGGRAAC